MNFLCRKVGIERKYKKKPSNWDDIVALQQFMLLILQELERVDMGKLDRYLMMYGRDIKEKRPRKHSNI